MPSLTREDVLRLAQEHAVRFIRLQFTDIFGTMKNVTVTTSQLEKALDNKMMFDGSSIEGFVRIEESDMYLCPDPNSFAILPFGTGDAVTARMICDIRDSEGRPFAGDPRQILRAAIAEAEQMGFTMYVGAEAEFFLFQTDADGRVTTRTNDVAGYFDLGPVDQGEVARREICLALEKIGFEVEASHHENAPGQHEIDFKYADALTSADNIMTFKLIVRTIAQKHGLHATFMPKPVYGIAGSGMHMNQSLFREGKNAFYDAADPRGLSQVAYQYIAGLLEHARGMAAITNPLVNSYKRLVSGYEAPVYITWSAANRSPLVRIPSARGSASRVELRNPDPSCNPYLAIAVALRAGLDGIKRGLTAPEPTDFNLYELNDEQRQQRGIRSLPHDLTHAVRAMQLDPLIRETLGDHVFGRYVEAKTIEWDEYRNMVTQWELDSYLGKY